MAAKRRMFTLALVLASLLHQLAAVRMANDDENGELDASDDPPTTTCVEEVQKIFATVTWRELYSPIFNGAYRIRNRFSGEYLTEGSDNYLGASLLAVSTSQMSDWRLKRVKKAGMPVYTLQNRKSGNYMIFEGEALSTAKRVKGEWSLDMAADGVHHILRLNSSLAVFDFENRVRVGEHSADMDEVESLKGEWYLEAYPSWWRQPKSDKDGYAAQWKEASNLPIFPGAELTWNAMCADGDKVDCEASYSAGRQMFKEMGYIAETHRRYVTQNNLRGSCDMFWSVMKYTFNAEALSQMRDAAGSACEGQGIVDMRENLQSAIMGNCFDGCLASIQTVVRAGPCTKPDNATSFFEEIFHHSACNNIMPSSLEGLAEFALMEHCLDFHPPAPLWTAEFHDPRTLTKADGKAVCEMTAGKESSRNDKDLVRVEANGKCGAGTTCQCPSQFWTTEKTTLDLTLGERMFIEPGSSLDAFLTDELFGTGRSVALRVFVMGYTLSAALARIPTSPTFLPKQIWAWGNFFVEKASWRCQQTAGCWPNNPERKKTEETDKACRIPSAAMLGGSDVWFMPPPSVYLKRNPWYAIKKCEFAACTQGMMYTAKIGFAEDFVMVYNCQPLPYEAMGPQQKLDYLAKLRERLPAEYTAPREGGI